MTKLTQIKSAAVGSTDWESEYKKIAGCYTREGLKEFAEQHFSDSCLVDKSVMAQAKEALRELVEALGEARVIEEQDSIEIVRAYRKGKVSLAAFEEIEKGK